MRAASLVLAFALSTSTFTRINADSLDAYLIRHCTGKTTLSPAATAAEVKRLTNLLKVGTEEERSIAADDIACLGADAESAVPLMIKLFAARNGEIQANAIAAVARVGYSAVPHLMKALESADIRVKINACGALGSIGYPAKASLPSLAKLAVGAPETAAHAEIAMRKILCAASR